MSEENKQTDANTEKEEPQAVEVDLMEMAKNLAHSTTNQTVIINTLNTVVQRLDSLEQNKNKVKIINTSQPKPLTKKEQEEQEHANFFRAVMNH